MGDIEVRTSGTRITVAASDRIIIRLRENATTGYQWSLSEIDGPLQVDSNEIFPPEPMIPGAAAERVIVARPRGTGPARVSLQLKRAWEPEPIDRFTLDVDIS